MWPQLVLVSALLVVGRAEYLDDTYFAMMPKVLRPGQPFSVSLTYTYYSDVGQASVTLALVNRNSATTVQTQTYSMPPPNCGPSVSQGCPISEVLFLQVPDSNNLPGGDYNVTVSGSYDGRTFHNSTSVTVKRKSVSIFIQTDRAMYKPSQTIKFRVLTVHSDLMPVDTPLNISIHDTSENKIKQWLNVNPSEGVVSRQLELSDQPPLGDWCIQVVGQDTGAQKCVEIAEYVLPKYEVSMDVPSYFLIQSESLHASVSAKYTYGQPVKGNCTIKIQIKPYMYYDSSEYTHMSIWKSLENGRADFEVPKAQLLRIVPTDSWSREPWTEEWAEQRLSYRELLFMATCTEELTGKTLSKNGTVPVRNQKFNMQFMDITADNFKPGLDYTMFLQLTLADGSPPTPTDLTFPNGSAMVIEVSDRQYYSSRSPSNQMPANWTLTVDSSGMATASFRVPTNRTHLDLSATFHDGVNRYYSSKYVQPFNSRDKQGIQISIQGSTGKVQKGQDVHFEIETSEPANQAYLQLMSKGNLAYVAAITYPAPATSQVHTVTMTDELSARLAPDARAIVWYTTSGDEIISDSLDFGLEGAFANEVSLNFSAKEARPADIVSLTVSAFPRSYVGLLAIDRSAQLLATGNDLSQGEVIEELKSYDSTNTYDDNFGPGPRPMWRKKRSSWCPWCYQSTGGKDTKEVFENSGVLVMTDRFIYVEPPPHYYHNPSWYDDIAFGMPEIGVMGGQDGAAAIPMAGVNNRVLEKVEDAVAYDGRAAEADPTQTEPLAQAERIRTEFPETWLWTEERAGENGEVTIETVVPDTITSWVASAFAMSPVKGLGLSDAPATVNVFKPFFVSLDLPYSIIRGEEISMKMIVFNYLSNDLQVTVTLEKSLDFAIRKANEVEYVHAKAQVTLTVPAGDGATITMWVEPRVLGNIPIEVKAQSTMAADAVRRMLLVEPEGAPQEYNTNFMVDLTEQSTFTDEVELTLPDEGLVLGSVRITATAIGDIMGPSMNGLERLVKMPSGCGEQNMLNFAPNIFVMDYLKAANKQDPELEAKAIGFMEKGYQRELTYQHHDGSFSAFGNSDPSGSTWLTAFVMKSFCEARNHLPDTIDSAKVTVGLRWLLEQQDDKDGHFREPGRVIHTDMQGGAASGIALTGYVTVTLLEACFLDEDANLRDDVALSVDRAIAYLLEQYDRGSFSDDAYTLAIVTYALVKDGHSRAQELSDVLDGLANEENGMKHWSKQEQDTSGQTYHYEDRVVFAPPRHQATASEIETTAYALLTLVQDNRISYAIPVMKWLISQRNSLGGYSSTQDTVMALQALASYAASASGGGNQQVSIVLEAGGYEYRFPNDITPLNSVVLQQIDLTAAMYQTLTIRGTGQGIALVQVSVQYNVDNLYEDPGMNLEVTSEQISDGIVHVQVCGWYTGDGPSGMVGLEVNPLTGFVATNLDELQQSTRELSRVEMVGRKYMFYFNQMEAQKTCVTVHMERVNIVANVKKALVTSYVYYQPTVRRTTFYMPRDFLGQDVCSTCRECCVDGGMTIEFTDISGVNPGEEQPPRPGKPTPDNYNVIVDGHEFGAVYDSSAETVFPQILLLVASVVIASASRGL